MMLKGVESEIVHQEHFENIYEHLRIFVDDENRGSVSGTMRSRHPFRQGTLQHAIGMAI